MLGLKLVDVCINGPSKYSGGVSLAFNDTISILNLNLNLTLRVKVNQPQKQ